MTLEDAKKLKPGDRVLVEAIIRGDEKRPTIDSAGDVRLTLETVYPESCVCTFVKPEAIREKIAPPRRKFRAGDIVTFCGYMREVECFNPTPMLGLYNGGDDPEWVEADEVKLVCAVEDRTDRKEDA